jgi:hypothetical protein
MEFSSPSMGLSRLRDNVIVRLVAYYTGAFLFFVFIGALFPSVVEYVDLERARVARGFEALGGPGGETGFPFEAPNGIEALLTPERSIPVLLSMIGALALALPVAWIYTWTSPNPKTRQGIARTLLVLPIAIALVVFLVKGSLALAFSLAGIVAAVRFRASLTDTTDAVFLFVVIGIGLSAGVQLMAVAFIGSVVFAAITLTVWRTRFAEHPAHLEGFQLLRSHPEVPWPPTASGEGSVHGASGNQHPPTLFLIHSGDPEPAQQLADLVFGRYAKEWALARVAEEERGTTVLEFSVKLKKKSDPDTVIRVLRATGGAFIEDVESRWGNPGT